MAVRRGTGKSSRGKYGGERFSLSKCLSTAQWAQLLWYHVPRHWGYLLGWWDLCCEKSYQRGVVLDGVLRGMLLVGNIAKGNAWTKMIREGKQVPADEELFSMV